jgi:hypothetical protein
LLEPQRTNLALRSEEFENASWVKTASTITANTTISPSGIQNADTLIGNGTLSSHSVFQAVSLIGGANNTISVYAKKGTNNFLQIYGFSTGYGVNTWANFDLNNGVMGSVGSSATATITNVGNGWYRCTVTFVAVTTVVDAFIFNLITSATAARGEVSTLSTSVFLWGAQLEAGAYATSYIPTTSASVTRNADVVSKTGISSLIGQTEGTIFYEFSVPIVEDITRVLSVSGSSVSNRINIATYANTIIVRVDVGGVMQVSASAPMSVTNMNKIAFRYKANDFSLYVNGVNVITDTSGITFPAATLDRISNLQPDGTFQYNGNIKAIALWKTGLTNAQLAALTT